VSNYKHMKTCNLYGESLDWINGELLGDGCIQTRSQLTGYFVYTSKYLEYIKYVSDTLQRFGIDRAGKIRKNFNSKFNKYTYQYGSCSYYELKILQEAWYLDGIKDVPMDIKLTPLVCRQWYIGDGNLYQGKECRPSITLATCSFSISAVNRLVKQLISMGFHSTRKPSNNVIHISTYSTSAFINYIGKCPVDCYKYKWDLTLHKTFRERRETYVNPT